MTNHGNILPPGQFEQLSSFFGMGQEALSRTITSLTSQVHSCVWHVFFAQLLSKNKVQRTSESTIQTVWEGDKTGPVLMSENNGGKFQWITLHLFSRTPCEISCAFLELVFLSLLLGRYQDFVICVAAGSKGLCCLPILQLLFLLRIVHIFVLESYRNMFRKKKKRKRQRPGTGPGRMPTCRGQEGNGCMQKWLCRSCQIHSRKMRRMWYYGSQDKRIFQGGSNPLGQTLLSDHEVR